MVLAEEFGLHIEQGSPLTCAGLDWPAGSVAQADEWPAKPAAV